MRSHRKRIRRVADRHDVSTLGHIRVNRFAVQAQHHRVLLHRRALILNHVTAISELLTIESPGAGDTDNTFARPVVTRTESALIHQSLPRSCRP